MFPSDQATERLVFEMTHYVSSVQLHLLTFYQDTEV